MPPRGSPTGAGGPWIRQAGSREVESRRRGSRRAAPMAADLELDLTRPHAIHVVGVGGAGMSAIAPGLGRMGHPVSGSDLRESRVLERLELLDVTTSIGHAAEHLPAELD